MTLSPWIIYFWGIADQARQAVWVAFAIFTLLTVIFLLATSECDPENEAKWCRRAIATLFCALFFWLSAVFVPTSRTVAVMVVAPAIVNSEPIQKDLPEIYQLAKDALKQTLTIDKK